MTKPVFPRGRGRPIAAFRQADPADLPAMLAVIADAQLALRQQGVDQWQNGYPNEAALSEDIAAGGAYVLLRDSLVIATMALLPGPEPTYRVIDGRWLTGGPYCVIHRLAVHSHFKGAGAAARMLQEAEALCRLQRVPSLRVDTHHDNRPMQRFLEKNGFLACGDIRLADGAPRLAFEKVL